MGLQIVGRSFLVNLQELLINDVLEQYACIIFFKSVFSKKKSAVKKSFSTVFFD